MIISATTATLSWHSGADKWRKLNLRFHTSLFIMIIIDPIIIIIKIIIIIVMIIVIIVVVILISIIITLRLINGGSSNSTSTRYSSPTWSTSVKFTRFFSMIAKKNYAVCPESFGVLIGIFDIFLASRLRSDIAITFPILFMIFTHGFYRRGCKKKRYVAWLLERLRDMIRVSVFEKRLCDLRRGYTIWGEVTWFEEGLLGFSRGYKMKREVAWRNDRLHHLRRGCVTFWEVVWHLERVCDLKGGGWCDFQERMWKYEV